jgi:hypothetical protein
VLGVGFTALSFSDRAILTLKSLSSYSIIEDGQSITSSYTSGYLLIVPDYKTIYQYRSGI